MKIKKIDPPRKFYPTNNKKLCLKDTLHINVVENETYILNNDYNQEFYLDCYNDVSHYSKDFLIKLMNKLESKNS